MAGRLGGATASTVGSGAAASSRSRVEPPAVAAYKRIGQGGALSETEPCLRLPIATRPHGAVYGRRRAGVQPRQRARRGRALTRPGAARPRRGRAGEHLPAPVERTLVDELVDAGYDVWLENWRASIDLPPNEWTLDQAAEHDHPRAVRKVVAETGADEVKAVIHCQGSTSFMMSAVAGLVPEVKTIVANAVTLHPVIPRISRFKLKNVVPLVGRLTPYMNPQWGLVGADGHREGARADGSDDAPRVRQPGLQDGQLHLRHGLPGAVAAREPECGHARVGEAGVRPCAALLLPPDGALRHGRAAGRLGHEQCAPQDYAAQPPQTDARFAFFAGSENICFLPESQRRTHAWFEEHRPGGHTLVELPGYGHLDVFMGQNAARDVFPLMLAELER